MNIWIWVAILGAVSSALAIAIVLYRNMPSPSAGPWRLVLPAAELAKHRSDPRLHRILTIGRIINSLHFAEAAIFDRKDDDSPAGTRQRTAGFLYSAALLYEALKFADRLGEHFRHLNSFKTLLVPILQDSDVQDLRQGLLERLRNQAVYHHDDDVMPIGLESLRVSSYPLAEGATGRKIDLFHATSDYAVISYGLGPLPAGADFTAEFQRALERVIKLQLRLSSAFENLFGEACVEMGWRELERDSPAT